MLKPRSEFLRFELLVDEASGGVMARALALEGLPALSINAGGEGPYGQIKGNAQLRAGDLAFIETSFLVAVGDQIKLQLEGNAQVSNLVDESLRHLLQREVSFAVDGMFYDDKIQVHRGFLANDLTQIEVSGVLDDFNVDFDLTMTVNDLQALSAIVGTPLQGQAKLLTRLHSDDIRRGLIASNIQASFTEVLPTDTPWAALVGPRINVTGDIEFDSERHWEIRDLVLTGDALASRVTGSLRDFNADFDVTLAVDDLLPLSDIAGLPLQGQAKLHMRILSDDIRRGVIADNIQASFSDTLPPTSALFTLLTDEMNVSGNLEFDSERQWSFDGLVVTASAVELVASGSINGETGELDLDYQLVLPQAAVLSEALGTPVAGKLSIIGNLDGDLVAPTLTANIISPALAVDGFKLGATEARVNIAQFDDSIIGGDIDLSITDDLYGRIELASRFSLQGDDSLQLDDLVLASRGTRLAGEITVDLSRSIATGKLKGQNIALAPWSELAQRSLSGSASLSLDLGNSDNSQQLELTLNATGLNIELDAQQSMQVNTIEVSARLDDLFGKPGGAMRLLASDASISSARLRSIAFEGRMDDQQLLQGRLQAQGDFQGPFELGLSAEYRAQEQGFIMTVLEAEAKVFEQTIKLSEPARLHHDNDLTSLSESTIHVADGSLTIAGKLGPDQIDARVGIEGISIAALLALAPQSNLTGTVSGQAHISGSRVAPSGEMDLKIIDMQAAHSRSGNDKSISGKVHGEWHDQRLHLSATLAGFALTGLDARLSVPLSLEPETLAFTMPMDLPVVGKLSWSGDMEPVWNLLSLHEDRFTGPGEIALKLEGTLEHPQLGGYFQVSGGHYENLQTSTTLVDVNLRLEGDGDKLVLEKLTAGDGKSGSLLGSGFIEFNPVQAYPVHLRLQLENMQLVDQDNVTLNTSGKLSIEGSLSNTLLSGEFVTGQSEINLAASLPPSVVDLEVEEVNVSRSTNAKPIGSAASAEPSTILLDLNISVPGRAFVRGLGLESEWAGDILLSGNANTPRLTGALNPVRGRFFLMGRSFRLEQGSIRFSGTEDIDPVLDLTAEYRADSLTALVRVTGTASKPEILLTSRPPLPESEIASQVLFGTNSGDLTTAQSLQLAAAIASYSGRGGAVGILDATRRVLRVDVINFTESEENPDQTRVSVGKYISEGVFLEIEGGGHADSRASTTIEVDILPNVRVEGGTTETGGSKAGIKWKWDY